jgi:hypothetical protein
MACQSESDYGVVIIELSETSVSGQNSLQVRKKMKKQTALVIIFVTVTLGLFAQQGSIRDLSGTVELKPAGAAAFIAAKAGDRIAANTIISTGFKSTAVINVGSATLMVQPLTRMSMAEIFQAQGSERLDIQLQSGRIRVEVRPPAGTRADTSVRTPVATASVRGTIFDIDSFSLRVVEGKVAYRGKDDVVVLVRTGGSSQIDPVTGRAADPVETSAAALLPPLPAGAERRQQWKGAVQNLVDLTISISF